MLPNSVTLAFMKLIAMRDRRLAAQDGAKSDKERDSEESQARKHAHDVCRVMAMITRKEGDLAAHVLETIRASAVFADAADTFSKFFGSEEAWGTRIVASTWRPEDLQLIQRTLATWFR